MAVIEVCLVLWFMGIKFCCLSALVIEAMSKLVNVVGSINPGHFGTYEGGNMLIGKTFGLTGATGLVLGLTRRLRGFFWAAVGGICLFILTRSRTPHDTHDRGGTPGIAEEKGEADADATVEVAARSSFALASFLPTGEFGHEQFGAGLADVGSLPILLRNILAVRKLGPSRIMVAVDPILRRRVQRQLWWTGRLPESVQCIEANPAVPVFQQSRLMPVHAGRERLVTSD